MSEIASLPRAIEPFIDFVAILRANGFAVAPEQTESFLSAIGLLGPRDLEDVRRGGLATLAPPPERHAAFHALFDMHFLAAESEDLPEGEEDDVVRVQEDRRGVDESISADESNESGQAATRAEALVERRFGPVDTGQALRRLTREAARRLPKRLSYRRSRARRGAIVDLRRTLREATRNDGEIIKLPRLKRRMRPRKALLLIDVSGSMKERTEENLLLAHALVQASPRVEVFTFGTRLTRVTRPMRLKRRAQALAGAGHIVSDFDGGTRIGDALKAFLAVPRFSTYARGAITLIVSDGLERGDPTALADAVARLSRRAWRLSWLTPLAVGHDFRPRTEALVAIFPFVDDMVDGGSTSAIVNHVLALGRRRAA
jgi:uncharacterized protein with von Willebrand factor type A (vWA) domain